MANKILGNVLGKTQAGLDFGLSPSAASNFAIFSKDLISSSSTDFKQIQNWPVVPAGQPVNLIALLPEPSSSLGTNGVAGKDATTLKYSVPAQIKWKVQFVDLPKKVTGELPEGIQGSPTDLTHLASTTFDDVTGTHQILSGDLSSLQLTILPWPYSGEQATLDDSKMRVMRVYLEVSIFFPGVGQTTFSLTDGLYGIIENWYSVFGTSPAITPFDQLTQPRPTDTPTAGLPKYGRPDPLATFRDMFIPILDNATPEVGHPTNILLKAQDQITKIPMKVAELIGQKPEMKVNAAVDFGAILQGIVDGITSLFTGGSPSPQLVEAELNIAKVLTSIFSLPIAVKIDGLANTTVLRPAQPSPLASLTAIPDTALTLVNVPIGDLNVLSKIDAKKLTLKFDQVDQGNAPEFKFLPLGGALGGQLWLAPQYTGPGSLPPVAIFKITIPLDVKLPGRKRALQLKLPDLPIDIKLPTIPLPQMALLTRAQLHDVLQENDVPENFYFPDILLAMCPQTRRRFPNLDLAKIALRTLYTTVQTALRMFPPPGVDVNQFLVKTPHDGLVSLSNTVGRMLKFLTSPRANVYIHPQPHYLKDQHEVTVLWKQNPPLWGKDAKGVMYDSNLSSILWIGPPRRLRDFTLCTELNPGLDYIFYSYEPDGVPAILREGNEPVTGLWLHQYTSRTSARSRNEALTKSHDTVDKYKVIHWLYKYNNNDRPEQTEPEEEPPSGHPGGGGPPPRGPVDQVEET